MFPPIPIFHYTRCTIAVWLILVAICRVRPRRFLFSSIHSSLLFPPPVSARIEISNSGIRGMRIVVASSSVGCKRSHTEEEEGRRKRRGEGKRDPKQRQTVVNRAQTSGARVPVSLVHIGSNLQTRPCHVAGKRFAYLLFSLRRIVPLRSRYFSSYLYVVINNACNSPP